jgi:hypothetical protein
MLWEDGSVTRIVKLFDWNGFETSEPEECVAITGAMPDGRWISMLVNNYESRATH